MTVNTVTGEIDVSEMGWTLPHEHIIVAWDGTFLDSTMKFDWDEIETEAVRKFQGARDSGVHTIVDMTTIEMGRDVELMRRVSEASEVQIIAITGLFADAYGIPNYFRELSRDELTDLFVTELTKGIGTSGIRAGAIKVATGQKGVTEIEERILRAAAKAQLETGVPILTHTGFGAAGDMQVEILGEEGVPPERIVVGHSDVSANVRYHVKIARLGANVGFDRIGLKAFMPDEIRAQCIAGLIRLGYGSQITMSLDAHVRWCGRPNALTEEDREFTSLSDEFFPLLREAGVTDADIKAIMTQNVMGVFGA